MFLKPATFLDFFLVLHDEDFFSALTAEAQWSVLIFDKKENFVRKTPLKLINVFCLDSVIQQYENDFSLFLNTKLLDDVCLFLERYFY